MNETIRAINQLRPNSTFAFGKNSQGIQTLEFDYLIWLDENTTAPTKTQVEVEIARQEAERYKEYRAPEYPPLADLADAVYWQSQGDESKMTAYLAAVEAVKIKYPKGAE
jgi:hypothetical protein